MTTNVIVLLATISAFIACDNSTPIQPPPIPEESSFTLSFNSNGGSAIATQIIEFDETARAPTAPTREGYFFQGWFTDNETFNNAYNFSTPLSANITLYASWTIIPEYTVSFNTNGGSAIATQTIESGETARAPPTAPTREGYSFQGWFTDNETFNDAYDFSNPVSANIILYANWTIIPEYTVSFNTNEGSAIVTQTIESGETATAPPTVPTRSGYSFQGWFTDNETFNNVYDFITPLSANITLYAKWTIIPEYTVSFNMNGGEEIADVEIDSNTALSAPPSPIPTNREHGGTFENWYTTADLSTPYNFSTPVTSNTTLYAKWDYMVTYDANTGTALGLVGGTNGDDVDLVIPSNVNGKILNSIRESAFKNNQRIKSLRIAEGIKIIADSAFYNCGSMTGNLAIPNSVTTIGSSAFKGCVGFTGSLTLSDALTTIEGFTFNNCSGFTGSLTIPNRVTTIGTNAFSNCSGFTGSLAIPNRVTTIGSAAFANCSSLDGNVTIPSSVTTIGGFVFNAVAQVDTFIFLSSTPPTNVGLIIFTGIPLGDLNISVPDEVAVMEYIGKTNLSLYSTRIFSRTMESP